MLIKKVVELVENCLYVIHDEEVLRCEYGLVESGKNGEPLARSSIF